MRWLTSDNKTADTDEKIFIGKGEADGMADACACQSAWPCHRRDRNRQDRVAAGDGGGFARAGVPVFAADIKGDLSGISEVGEAKDFILKRAGEMGLNFQPDQFSTVFWDVFGEQGHPVRATVTEMGPLLLSRMLDLNDVQEGVLNVAFRVADENGLTLIDMKDLRALLDAIAPAGGKKGPDAEEDELADIRKACAELWQCQQGNRWNHSAPASGAGKPGRNEILRRAGADAEGFHEDRQRRPRDDQHPGRRQADAEPEALRHLLLWMLSELFEELPEAGDLPKPKLVFFFDEAHLLFNDAPKALMDKIEQVVRLIRSKGVGVYFVTQKPDRRAGQGAGPVGRSRAARAARLYAARPEGGEGGGADLPAESRSSIPPASSWNSARARRWCRSSKAAARRPWSSAS
jgi:hypothetical protein